MSTPTYDKRHARSVLASSTLAKARFATLAGTHATPSDRVAGVTESDTAQGRLATLITEFSALVEAAGPVASGDRVGPASDGSGRAQAGGGAGVALTSASAAGQLLEVELFVASADAFAGLAAGDVASTTGVLGECRQISDGPDRGARLIWAVPDGATEPTWCWWLWPQSAY